MTKKYYDPETDCEIMVEEFSRKEALQYAIDFIDGIETCRYLSQDPENYIYIEYNDGSYYCNLAGDEYGKLKKTNIKGIILDDGYEYYIFGNYEMSKNLIPNLI